MEHGYTSNPCIYLGCAGLTGYVSPPGCWQIFSLCHTYAVPTRMCTLGIIYSTWWLQSLVSPSPTLALSVLTSNGQHRPCWFYARFIGISWTHGSGSQGHYFSFTITLSQALMRQPKLRVTRSRWWLRNYQYCSFFLSPTLLTNVSVITLVDQYRHGLFQDGGNRVGTVVLISTQWPLDILLVSVQKVLDQAERFGYHSYHCRFPWRQPLTLPSNLSHLKSDSLLWWSQRCVCCVWPRRFRWVECQATRRLWPFRALVYGLWFWHWYQTLLVQVVAPISLDHLEFAVITLADW